VPPRVPARPSGARDAIAANVWKADFNFISESEKRRDLALDIMTSLFKSPPKAVDSYLRHRQLARKKSRHLSWKVTKGGGLPANTGPLMAGTDGCSVAVRSILERLRIARRQYQQAIQLIAQCRQSRCPCRSLCFQ
jgi:hypothetical protein